MNSIIDLLTYVFSTSNGPDQERYFALLQKFLRAACLVRARDGLNVIDEALEKIKKIDDLQVIFHIHTNLFNFPFVPIYLIFLGKLNHFEHNFENNYEKNKIEHNLYKKLVKRM